MKAQEAKVIIEGFLGDDETINEAIEMAAKALDKQEAKKIREIHLDEYYCPACGSENDCDMGLVEHKFCPECGQALK